MITTVLIQLFIYRYTGVLIVAEFNKQSVFCVGETVPLPKFLLPMDVMKIGWQMIESRNHRILRVITICFVSCSHCISITQLQLSQKYRSDCAVLVKKCFHLYDISVILHISVISQLKCCLEEKQHTYIHFSIDIHADSECESELFYFSI